MDRRDGKVWGLHGEMGRIEGVCVREAIVNTTYSVVSYIYCIYALYEWHTYSKIKVESRVSQESGRFSTRQPLFVFGVAWSKTEEEKQEKGSARSCDITERQKRQKTPGIEREKERRKSREGRRKKDGVLLFLQCRGAGGLHLRGQGQV